MPVKYKLEVIINNERTNLNDFIYTIENIEALPYNMEFSIWKELILDFAVVRCTHLIDNKNDIKMIRGYRNTLSEFQFCFEKKKNI